MKTLYQDIPSRYFLVPIVVELTIAAAAAIYPQKLYLPARYALLPPLALCCLASWNIVQLYRVVRRRGRSELPAYVIQDSSEIPLRKGQVFLGKGFEWRRDEADLLCRTLETVNLQAESPLGGKPIIHGISRTEKDCFLDAAELNGHTCIVGTTRVGKTRALELLVTQAIRRGEPVVVVDPKGDNDLVNRVYDECHRAGRERDFKFFSLAHPDLSVPYNPLSNMVNPTDVATRIALTLPSTGDSKPFTDFSWLVLTHVVGAITYLGLPLNLHEINRFTSAGMEELSSRLSLMVQTGIAHLPRWEQEQLRATSEQLNHLANHPGDHFRKMTAGLSPVLTSLTTGAVRQLLCPDNRPDQITWGTVSQANQVCYMYLGAMIDRQIATNVAKMAIQDLLFYVGLHYADQRQPKAFSVFIDEFYNVVFDGIVDLLNKAGGAGTRVTFALQTLSDIESVTDRAKALQILGNTNTKIFMRTTEYVIAEQFSNLFGTVNRKVIMHTKGSSPKTDAIPFSTNRGERLMDESTPLIRPDWIMSLPKGHAFLYTQGRPPVKLRFPQWPNTFKHTLLSEYAIRHPAITATPYTPTS